MYPLQLVTLNTEHTLYVPDPALIQSTYQKLADLYKNKMAQPEKAKKLWATYNEKNKS